MIRIPARLRTMRFASLRHRIAIVYAGLFAVLLAAIMAVMYTSIDDFAERSSGRELAANARVFDELLALRSRQMRGSADVLSRDFGFREAIATNDAPTIRSALDSVRKRSRTDAAFVVGLDGAIVASGTAPPPPVDAIWSALDEGRQRGVLMLGDDPALGVVSAIEAPDLVGWLVLAQPLDPAHLNKLTSAASADLEARVGTSTSLAGTIADAPLGQIVERRTDEARLVRVSALPTLQDGLSPRLVLSHSLAASLREYTGLKLIVALLASAGLALVVFCSLRLARTVTKPIDALVGATRRIGEGDRAKVRVSGDDEVGRLAVSFNAMVDAIEEREQRITHVALHDGLTDLPNRKLFIEQLDQCLQRRSGTDRVMVVYIDLDDFKLVNDTLGHPAGDALLRDVALNLVSELDDAVVARLGGDEFAVLLRDFPATTDLAAVGERIQSCFQRSIVIQGQQAECSASMGIAVAPDDGNDSTVLMKNADLALYRAKQDGKSSHHFFEPSLDEHAQRRRQMELDLRVALREGGFQLYFQPLYSITESRLKGFEALIRWNHPVHGLVSPLDFIPLAEETGLIVPIGDWVLREACAQAASWPGELAVAVNISPKQFLNPSLSTTILQALAGSGLAPGRLELEITESIFIANVEKTLECLHALQALGVRIALDDFGTGYSSLSYLRSFPFDKLKIDQSFVRDLALGGNAHAVIRAITTLADALGMETLAEGVEELAQLEILEREGCRQIQGYLLSRPIEAGAVANLVAEITGENSGLHRKRA